MIRFSATIAPARAHRPTRAAIATALLISASLAGCSDDEPSGVEASSTSGSGASGGAGSGGAGSGGAAGGAGNGGSSAGGSTGSGGAGPSGRPFVYIGQGNGEIAVLEMEDDGTLEPRSTVSAGDNPSFLAATSNDAWVYAALEGGDQVAAFDVDFDLGGLSPLNTVSSQGNGPAYVSVDLTDKWVFVANYGSGTVAVLPILGDGSLGEAVDTESPGQNSHLIRSDPKTNNYVFVPNKGSDTISQYLFNSDTGQLEPNDPPSVQTADGAGPRHLDFHPDLPIVYVINENDDTLSVYDLVQGGTLSEKQTLSTLPDGVGGGDNTCADVHVSVDGKFVYGSNRGDDSIVVFAVDATDGTLTLVEHEPSGGDTPRNFGLHPDGGKLLVANQASNTVVTMSIDPATGALAPLATTDTDGGPSWVGILTLLRYLGD